MSLVYPAGKLVYFAKAVVCGLNQLLQQLLQFWRVYLSKDAS